MRKPSLKSISFFFSIFFIIFVFGIGVGLYINKQYYPSDNDHNFRSISETPSDKDADTPVLEIEQYITADTAFIWQSVDIFGNTIEEKQIPVPEMYIGLKREGFLEKIEEMKENPPLSELEKGFLGIEVLEFSPRKILVRANYQKEEQPEQFYLMVKDHYIVIFYSDKKTVYMNTGILLENLPDELQMKIIQGYEMKGEQELYNFLESYTS